LQVSGSSQTLSPDHHRYYLTRPDTSGVSPALRSAGNQIPLALVHEPHQPLDYHRMFVGHIVLAYRSKISCEIASFSTFQAAGSRPYLSRADCQAADSD